MSQYTVANLRIETEYILRLMFGYLQLTLTVILLLTEGGTLLEAMQRYAPISERAIFVNLSSLPSTTASANQNKSSI